MAVMAAAEGFGMLLPAGTKAIVISWSLASLMATGSLEMVGLSAPGGCDGGHTLICTLPTLPASGVCFGHF